MSFMMALFYDKIMQPAEQACLIEWRRGLLESVEGRVLELGAGTGASIGLYPRDGTLELFLAEPEPNMRQQLHEKVAQQSRQQIKVLDCPGERIDSEDDFYDVVFVSLVCCSVNDVAATLAEIKRVLKPEGRFLFLEHVAAPADSGRRKWQNRLNCIWRKMAGNCHLNRETEQSIKKAGFVIEQIDYDSMRKSMPLVRPIIRGVARPA
ncbi:2-methoxy-6-polyprenyl-1,4-benzoquinol methylase, mitochondrial [Sinobacterium norvegicum]|uniref:2-methoxy-6-polyprenyl-1,4-benzoquinol methylase, mitochondrial n=1 Tax=Sinobacterium norvegicum TaxID=1641715 RepID=A0ABN8EJB1_9GAMM|nr:class I SAM-dependent methyltransferase [Sinobacterium norvegicum]CAH0992538.1 2-methoxy-6-polyprenyl-1,4-benzoquinol methylase, mitochondrial [Sinobacterium norvegicum]